MGRGTRNDRAGDVAIVVYEYLKHDSETGFRLRHLAMARVSTRIYAEVIPPMAKSDGISRRLVEAIYRKISPP